MNINEQFYDFAPKLNEALLTSPATKSDCALHIINVGGLSLSQAAVERAIDLIIADLYDELILTTADYATLLARHQSANNDAVLRQLMISTMAVVLRYYIEVGQTLIADAIANYTSLTLAQRNAIDPIKKVTDEGVESLNRQITDLTNRLSELQARRSFGS